MIRPNQTRRRNIEQISTWTGFVRLSLPGFRVLNPVFSFRIPNFEPSWMTHQGVSQIILAKYLIFPESP